MEKQRVYIAIDLKSFYASVECVARQLDPLTTNLVVADESRTEKTICLAVSPSLKAYGIPGRARLFEVISRLKEVNALRLASTPDGKFRDKSIFDPELKADPSLEVSCLIAKPRMAQYMKVSTEIYNIYLNYIAPEDIHVYSVDEVFMDVTGYLKKYKLTPRQLAETMIRDVMEHTGITATVGIGTNLYLCKVAMDIVAKHIPPDKDGVRIAELDERSYREQLWSHRPLTDFWRVGAGYARKLEAIRLYTMGDIARCSVGKPDEYYNEELLYRMFGVNAELLIDHAWGWEPTLISDIKAYKPEARSISSGQVLQHPYEYAKARIVVREMTEQLVLELVEKHLLTNQLVLTIGYDSGNLTDPELRGNYGGEILKDRYGRSVPKHAHGTGNLDGFTSSTKKIMECVLQLYDRIVNPELLVRRINVVAERVQHEEESGVATSEEQLSLFEQNTQEQDTENMEKEHKLQQTMIDIRRKFGRNAILKGTNFREGATSIERNTQIGGHKA